MADVAGLTPDAETLRQLAGQAADASAPAGPRAEAAGKLAALLTEYGRLPLSAQRPKLSTLLRLIPPVRDAFHAASDPALRAALASALGNLHLEMHTILKPDDLAQARATALYRAAHPAANHAAEAIVIYPTTEAQRKAIEEGMGE